MGEYIGLDVSLKETAVSIRRDGQRIWRGKCVSDPQALAALIRKHAADAEKVVFETGSLSVWFYHALTSQGLSAICIDARHAKAALDMAKPMPTTPTGWPIWQKLDFTVKSASRPSTACSRVP
jgi:transposase